MSSDPRPADPEASPRPARRLTLLYVEDEGDARRMVSRMLIMNYPELNLLSAENGQVGLDEYRAHRPDIVMTDINMPVLDGIKMSREIRSIDPSVPIIAVTAHSDTSYLMNAIELGIRNYVLKPINYDNLFREIDKTLEQIGLQRVVAEQNRRIAESEIQLSAAQKIAHLGSLQWNLTDGAVSFSAEMLRLLGLEEAPSPPSLDLFLERVHPQDREALAREIRSSAQGGVPLRPRYSRIVRPDGTLRTLRVESEFLRDQGGEPLSLICSSLDVTELRAAEEEIRSLTDELERRVAQRTSLLQVTLKELESFSYVVSHDLRAPVARLEGFCRALVEDCSDCVKVECRAYMERADRVVHQVKSIISAFNELSHYARCRMVVETVDLSAVARAIADGLIQRDRQRRAEFRIADQVIVRGDARLLRIALEQLLDNAWKFTSGAKGARIEFGLRTEEGGDVYFVRDNGVGFDMKYVGKLFKPFQTIHSPGEFDWKGTSIGLATAHTIILRHGGRLWAEGEVGHGATFSFTLEKNPEPGSFLKTIANNHEP